MTRGFEGSAVSGLADDAVVECGVCWWAYDPRLGDEVGDIPPGVAFSALPEAWRCPSCDNDKSKFMVRDAGALSTPAPTPVAQRSLDARVEALLNAYRRAERSMIGLPVHNPALRIEAFGFRAFEDGFAGVVVTPWCMNIAYLHADPAAPAPGAIGSKRSLVFPSGGYTFILGRMDGVGVVETCSLFSPMDEFEDAAAAAEAARSAAEGLFEVEEPEPAPVVSRRFVLTRKGEAT